MNTLKISKKKSPYPFPQYGEIYLVYFNLLNRLRAIDKELRKRDYCGVVSDEVMEQVNRGLEIVLNIKKVV